MKKLFWLPVVCLLPPPLAFAETVGSISDQEFTCRDAVKNCLSNDVTFRKDCISSGEVQQSCNDTILHPFLVTRADADKSFTDQNCVRGVDAELLGLLTKGSFSTREISELTSKLTHCKEKISDEFLNP